MNLLSRRATLVLDLPANTVRQREWLKTLAEQANTDHVLHYIDDSDSLCKSQLLKKATENPERADTDTLEMFEAINKYFEPPTDRECLTIVLHKSG